MKQQNGFRGGWLLFPLLLIVLALVFMPGRKQNELSYQQFKQVLESGDVGSLIIYQNEQTPTGEVRLANHAGEVYVTYVSDVNQTQQMLQDMDIDYSMNDVPQTSYWMSIILPVAVSVGAVVLMLIIMNMRAGAGGGTNAKMMNFGKSRARMTNTSNVTFKNVAGLQEEKEDLEEMVDFLRNPQKYTSVGARIPKGVILVGPPGTGKTLLAKAVAGEANVPFFSLAGSDFVEMFVGVGASRVRDLFKEATKQAPCIIFIDEIDAIGKSRDSRYGGGNDEREQTLNQLLAEMDGFDSSKGIFILAATNRPEVLDKALLRPGRLDRRVIVDKPDLKGRIETLKVHSKDVLMDDTVNFEEIGLATSGAVGSDLANMINEAAIAAVKAGRKYVSQKDLFEAVEVVIAGKEKKDRVLSKEEKQTVAYHEVGHALVTALKKDSEPVQKITIVPRTMGSLGYVMQVPEEEKYLQNKDELMTRLVTLVAGRAAEEIVFGKVTTGAANDIEKATKIAKAMITQYGMSERFGLMNLATVDDPYLNGNARLDCSDETAAQIDEEVKNMLKECYEEAKQLLTENRDVLDKIAHYLYDHETITGKEFMKIFREVKGLPEPTDTTGFTHSEKVAESVTFNEDGSYSSTLNGPSETDIWKGIGEVSSVSDSEKAVSSSDDFVKGTDYSVGAEAVESSDNAYGAGAVENAGNGNDAGVGTVENSGNAIGAGVEGTDNAGADDINARGGSQE